MNKNNVIYTIAKLVRNAIYKKKQKYIKKFTVKVQ